jgi:DNA-binding HxlR family transcriptional regulator
MFIYKCYSENGVMNTPEIKNKELYRKLKVISNKFRFLILEKTQNQEMSISELSKTIKLSYTKCADYISLLEKEGLIAKRKEGKEVFISNKHSFTKNKLEFL